MVRQKLKNNIFINKKLTDFIKSPQKFRTFRKRQMLPDRTDSMIRHTRQRVVYASAHAQASGSLPSGIIRHGHVIYCDIDSTLVDAKNHRQIFEGDEMYDH